jgi:hypothetical protein
MKIQKRSSHIALLVTLLLGCSALLPNIQAVVPPPDGGYPGGNTAEGQNALFSLTTGGFNTAVGFLSLRSDATNSFNTAIGAGTLLANTADQNTATGAGALLSNNTGFSNTANGAFALFGNNTGSNNTAVGHYALFSNTHSNANTAIGGEALANNTSGSQNTANGQQACLATRQAATISPWALTPALTSPRPITLSVSARTSQGIMCTTVVSSLTFSARHLPMGLPSSLIQTAGSEQ